MFPASIILTGKQEKERKNNKKNVLGVRLVVGLRSRPLSQKIMLRDLPRKKDPAEIADVKKIPAS